MSRHLIYAFTIQGSPKELDVYPAPVHKELFGEEAKLIAMHAGLECGVIGEKYPGMQMVSFGPTIVDPHSPNERVQISSVESFWRYLKAVLEKI